MHTTAKRKIINSAICCLLIFLLSHPAYAHTGGYDAAKLYPPTPSSTPSIASTHPRNFQVFGQEANKLVGDISKKAEWKDGSTEKMILHAIVGAVQANLGGGNALAGGLSGLTSEAVIPIMEQVLQNNGIQKGTSEYNSLMQLASTVIGGAAGAIASGGNTEGIGSGAATALSNIQNNYLKHQEILTKNKRLAECKGKECDDIKAEYKKISDERDQALMACQGDNSDACNGLRQEVRAAYAEILLAGIDLRKNRNNDPESKDDWNLYNSSSYAPDRLDTFKQAIAAMPDGRVAGLFASTLDTAIFEPVQSLGKGIFTFALGNLGDEPSKQKINSFLDNSWNLVTNLDKVPASIQNALDENTRQQAKAYLDGNSYALGEAEGKVVGTFGGIFLPIGGYKAAKGLEEATDAAKLLDRAATVAKDTEVAANAGRVASQDVMLLTPRGVAVTPETLTKQGTSALVGDFTGLNGATVDEIVSRVPSDWKMLGQKDGLGVRFLDETGAERIRIHDVNPNAPAGSNSASGWVLRVMDSEGNYYDAAGKLLESKYANEGHIPIYSNPKVAK